MNMASWNSSNFGGSRRSDTSSRTSEISESDEKEDLTVSSESIEVKRNNSYRQPSIQQTLSKISKNDNLEGQQILHINLTETENIILLHIPSLAISSDFLEEASAVKTSNSVYIQLCATKANNENFTERGMQTINLSKKNKDVQATGPLYSSSECQTNAWEIYDTYNKTNQSKLDDQHDHHTGFEETGTNSSSAATVVSNQHDLSQIIATSESTAAMRPNASEIIRQSMSVDAGSESDRYSVAGRNGPASGRNGEMPGDGPIEKSDKEAAMLAAVKAVVGNNYESKLIMYRNIVKQNTANDDASTIQGSNEDEELINNEQEEEEAYRTNIPTLAVLWSYRCDLTRGRSVAYMAWNKENEDILAVCYGENKHSFSLHQGLVLCWSLKNPEWPERIYKAAYPVTAIDFSKHTPNLLAAGFSDGRIAIYDVRQKTNAPILDNSNIPGKHHDPVWELKWVERERGMSDEHSKSEFLVSISTDGRVCQWQIKKGFEHTADLMVLKRVSKKTESGGNSAGNSSRDVSGGESRARPAALISRQAGGLCFDFNTKDKNIYLIGTEDGHIHRCSVSYNEQYLQTQFGHTGPVYKVKWSPFLPNIFLSCSTDWTVRLWNIEEESYAFKFQSGKNHITDIAWSPTISTIFGCVSNDGRLEVWDLRHSVLDPVVIHTVLDRQLTSIIFSSKSQCILVGDDSGAVSVFTLKQSSLPNRKSDVGLTDNSATQLEAVLKNQVGKPVTVVSESE
ncbi:WD repeat-containing protein 78 [Physocladia obscura]|uniref:Dynein axonemal intermediate chain 4 n=1 Tax=Physocladia obscura TaxID=109957 RepID=A0AAD5SSC6_9FUNG|nr:WD repeat-containing protein 78 [Physocladia obscura]